MASSLSISYSGSSGGVGTCTVNRQGINFRCPATNQMASFNTTTTIRSKRGGGKTPISMSASRAKNVETKTTTLKQKHEQKKSVSYDNAIDKWMKDSVVEIVKNLREAPLLVHVYNDGRKGEAPRLKTEKAVPENWLMVKSKWEDGTTPLPEGVIFVERLKQEEVMEPERESEELVDFGGESEITRAWGIVVQARGENCRPACYLLKTSRAGAGPGLGLGLCCTHFCLVKVKNFRETVEAQFKNCWLLNG